MLRGVDILANAVKMTLGPKGRNVVIDKSFGAPRTTKDSTIVAKEIELEDKFENLAGTAREACPCSESLTKLIGWQAAKPTPIPANALASPCSLR